MWSEPLGWWRKFYGEVYLSRYSLNLFKRSKLNSFHLRVAPLAQNSDSPFANMQHIFNLGATVNYQIGPNKETSELRKTGDLTYIMRTHAYDQHLSLFEDTR